MTTELQFGRDIQGYNAYAPYPSNFIWNATLTNGVETNITVPASYPVWIVSFRYYPNDVWVDVSGASAALPGSNTLTRATSELNPSSLTLDSGTNISVITGQATADISIVMWPVRNQ